MFVLGLIVGGIIGIVLGGLAAYVYLSVTKK